MGDAGLMAAGVARQAVAVVIGFDDMMALAPYRSEGAIAAAKHGGADVDGIHRGAKRHADGGIEFSGVGEMLEQLREPDVTLTVVETLRQHVGRQLFQDGGHRTAVTLSAARRPWCGAMNAPYRHTEASKALP